MAKKLYESFCFGFIGNGNLGKNIEVVYSTYPEISQLMGLSRIKYAVDGEPFSTSNKENIENYRIVSDYSAEWKISAGNEYSLPAYGLAERNYMKKIGIDIGASIMSFTGGDAHESTWFFLQSSMVKALLSCAFRIVRYFT